MLLTTRHQGPLTFCRASNIFTLHGRDITPHFGFGQSRSCRSGERRANAKQTLPLFVTEASSAPIQLSDNPSSKHAISKHHCLNSENSLSTADPGTGIHPTDNEKSVDPAFGIIVLFENNDQAFSCIVVFPVSWTQLVNDMTQSHSVTASLPACRGSRATTCW